MKVVGIIPARLGSTRIPDKMLADINGKPLIQHTCENVRDLDILDELIVATDSRRIFDVVMSFGCRAVMTSEKCRTGTDRVAEAARSVDCGIVINVQGDEMCFPSQVLEKVIQILEENADSVMGSVAAPILSEEDYLNPNVVKVVIDHSRNALYFTRAPVPHSKSGGMREGTPYYQHIGVYSYRRDFLLKYPDLKASVLEETESLEQLRALENGHRIKMAVVNTPGLRIDTPEDLEKAREMAWPRTSS